MTPAQQLGPYRLIERIGRGGMGEVWRARDTRLDREVAVKVSAEQFSDRFEREARAIAALNHPNICTLFDVGPNYLVMELIDGPTLADRIAEGPIPLEEALAIARQIADALEAAHEKNIVHRDLKPGNIKVRSDGSVKVLDFGLAKAGLPGAEVSHDSPTLVHSPTLVGVILGTAAYMAPEQARGKVVDKRADIWSFGVVLHEMLTGKRTFEGEDLTETLASVVKSDPDLTVIPHKVRRLLAKCLQKDPKKRLRDIGDAWDYLDDSDAPTTALSRSRLSMGWVVAGVFAVIAGTVSFLYFRQTPPTRVVTRFRYPLPEGQSFTRTGWQDLAVSPDGTRLAYVANNQLYLRAMDQLEAQPVRGTNEDPMEPVFSPDGQWLAYFVPAGGTGSQATSNSASILKKIPVSGGAPVTLSRLAGWPYGASWTGIGQNSRIAFGLNTLGMAGIETIPDTGGTPQTIVTLDAKKERAMQPRLLADGKHVMFVAAPRLNLNAEGQIVIQNLDGKDRKTIVNEGSDPRILPTGQLVYIHDGILMAVPFDSSRLTVTAGPVAVVEGIAETGTAAGQFAVSAEGTLVFRPGLALNDAGARPSALVWVDRQGHEQTISAKSQSYVYPRLSPDGTKIAVGAVDEEHDLWVFDLAKETLTRLTFGPAWELGGIWTPDSKSVIFKSGPSPYIVVPGDIFRKAVDGAGAQESLTQGEGGLPTSISPDGKTLVFERPGATAAESNLFVLPLEPKGKPHPLLADSKFNIYDAEISPDGRWIAYDSNESGRFEVYVRPFPAVDGGRWQISAEGGRNPFWARSGRELFFRNAANRMVVVPIPAGPAFASGSAFAFGKAETLLDFTPYVNRSATVRTWDISPDGQRFLAIKPVASDAAAAHPSIVVVSHWFDEVKARMAGGK